MTISIVIVDDHPSITWGLTRLIETESPRMQAIGQAHDLRSAQALLRETQPDVVLLDLDLGGQSSVELIAELAPTSTRFLIFTGLSDAAQHEAALVAGARGILSKNESPERILRAISCVHDGELWMERAKAGRLVDQLRHKSGPTTPDPFASLTSRERQIVSVIVDLNGAPNKQIANRLGITENTLRNVLSTIYAKTGASNRLQLFALALRQLAEPS